MPLDEKEMAILQGKGFVDGGDVSRVKIADALIDDLIENHLVEINDVTAIQQQAARIEQLTTTHFGKKTEGLYNLMRDLLTVSHSGAVQRRLAKTNGEGIVLCAWKIRVKAEVAGVEKMVPIPVRFVTNADEVVNAYYLSPKGERSDSAARSLEKDLAMISERRPGLAPYIQKNFKPQLLTQFRHGLKIIEAKSNAKG